MSDHILEDVARTVKIWYCRLRAEAQCVPKYWPTNEKWDKYWTGAALLCINHRVDPREFVEVQFYALKPWPEIPTLSSDKAMERFMRERKDHAFTKASAVMIQMDVLERLVELGNTVEEALTDEAQDFDPLFTYIAATANDLPDIAKACEYGALKMYCTSVHYDSVYKDLIPQRLKDMLSEVISREGTVC